MAIRSRKLLSPLILRFLSSNNAGDAMIRTTTAPTIFAAGAKENVLPQEAAAIVNFRLLPGDGVDYVIARVKKVIADPRVSVTVAGVARKASRVSDVGGPGYQMVERTIRELFPECAVAPFLVLGGTDARHYEAVSDAQLRFAPLRVGAEDQARAHGTNERVSAQNYNELIKFYEKLIRNSE